MVASYLRPSWDDPPSREGYLNKGFGQGRDLVVNLILVVHQLIHPSSTGFASFMSSLNKTARKVAPWNLANPPEKGVHVNLANPPWVSGIGDLTSQRYLLARS